MPLDLNQQIAERVADTKARLQTAETELSGIETDVESNQRAIDAAADAARPALELTKTELLDKRKRAKSIVDFYKKQLDGLLNRSWYDNLNWPSLLQYVVFTGLAITVLLSLLDGVNGPVRYGNSPRGMITFLIAVIAVGIAIILVLATILSDSVDREKRFNQGKEIFTALIGVLGTIVGYYFGTSLDDRASLRFEPIAVLKETGKPITISTRVVGGKGPFDYSIVFTSAKITTIKGTSKDGAIIETVADPAAQSDELAFTLRVDDAAGATAAAEYKLGRSTNAAASGATPTPSGAAKSTPNPTGSVSNGAATSSATATATATGAGS